MSNSFFRRRFPTLLAFFALLFFGLSGLRAQSNTEYNFRHQSTIVGDRYSNDADDAPQLTMSCLAANGYGQWTLSATAGTGITDVPTSKFVAGWYLLANGLYKPSTEYVALDPAHPGCFPPGVVQSDTLTFPTSGEVKATTNLSGMAAFAWPDSATRQFFTQFGFTASDVDLSFSFLTNPIPPMHEITSAIHSWPNVSTSVGLLTHAVVSETDFRDNFDVCSDGYYNYYVWASTDHPVIPGQKEIWVTIVPIGSGTALAGFPMQINAGGYFDGKFPTITCDPRNNRIGSPSPAFDVAYIQPSTSSIVYGSWSGAGWTTSPTALANSFWDPNLGSPGTGITWVSADHARIIRNSIYGGTSSLAIYAIVNSNNGVAHAALTPALIFYDPAHLSGTANYVAGSMMAPPAPIPASPLAQVVDAPIIAFADPYDNQANWHETDEFHCLYQYDLGIDASPRYPLCIVRGADVAAAWPDLYSTYTPDPSHEDTRLVLNQLSGSLENDPTNNWYVGAVNQMGIHVHWLADSSGKNVHYYARDQNRTFDEPIDENTLVTDICTVSDGSATGTNHGGAVGAEVLDLTRMAIWTDGNYGANLSDHTGNIGLWQPGDLYPITAGFLDPHVGTLNFIGENVVLQIGGLGADDLNAVLTDMPYFFCNFDPDVTGQGITIGPGSTFDYYGLIANHNTDGSIKYSGVEALLSSPFVIGGTDPIFGGGIITLAGVPSGGRPVLNIHGGADFGIGTGGELLSSFPAEIQVLYDGNVYPIPPHSRQLTGHATLHGYTLLDTTIVEGNIPADSAAVIATIIGYEGGGLFLGGHPQFDAESSWIGNADTNGASVILAEPELKPYDGITFNGCELDAANFHAIGPGTQTTSFLSDYAINIENCSFYEQHGRTIFIENLDAPTELDESYYNRPINITGNNFYTINHTLSPLFNPDSNANEVFGIYIAGLDGGYTDGEYPDLEGTTIVEDNNFTGKNWSNVYSGYPTPPNFEYAAAICFENTTGNIIGNTIDDTVYTNGIWLHATLYGASYPTSRTFVCSNTIQHLHPPAGDADPAPNLLTGIRTEYYNTGYIKLNTITDCEIGLSSNGDDGSRGFMIFNTIDNTHNSITYDIQQAIKITANSIMGSILDLSGIHGGGNDAGGFNDISGTYSDWETGLVTVGCNAIFNLGSSYPTCGTCVNYGENNLRLCTGPLSGCTQPTGTYAYIIKGLCGTATPLQNVDVNFWGLDVSSNPIDPNNGTGADPENWNLALGGSQVNGVSITYNWPVPHTLSAASTFSGVTCGSSRAITKHGKGTSPQSIDTITADSCEILVGLESGFDQDLEFVQEFDTAKYMIAHCINSLYRIMAVGRLSDAVQQGGGGPQPQAGINEWNYLLSILQLEPGDGDWLCGIANQLLGCGPNGVTVDTTWQEANTKTNEGLSLMYWIIHDSPCSNYGTNDTQGYISSRQSQYERYLQWPGLDRDTVPFDTTIYTMQQLGLDSVLKYAALLGASVGSEPSIITNPTAYPNPTGEGTVISFGITKEAYVIINLYDVLGHQVSSAGFEGVAEPGNLSVPISLQGLPSGTYFARIQTTYGEAQTLKLVKE